MRDLEKKVWAAAFAAHWAQEKALQRAHGGPGPDGFSCAELADEAVRSMRDAFELDDAEYLLPVRENWIP